MARQSLHTHHIQANHVGFLTDKPFSVDISEVEHIATFLSELKMVRNIPKRGEERYNLKPLSSLSPHNRACISSQTPDTA